MQPTVLITGCSSGIGYCAALTFARRGWKVFAGVRRPESAGAVELRRLATAESLPLQVIPLDVTSDADVEQAVRTVEEQANQVDVLVNNAGYGYFGPVEECDIADIRSLYDVNIFGIIRMVQAVLPGMRRLRRGRIINVSSVNGLLSFGLYGAYSSSKFALETLSEALRFEVKPFGIDVVVVEPGAFMTKFSDNSRRATRYTSPDSVYKGLRDPIGRDAPSGQRLRQHPLIRRLTDPQRVADALYRIAGSSRTRIRYKIGIDTRLYTLVRAVVPDRIWEWLLHTAYRW